MTRNTTAGSVVVGFDGHWPTTQLLPVAAEEAQRRDAELAIVTLVRPVADLERSALGLRAEDRRAADVAQHQLDAAATELATRFPGLVVSTHCLPEEEVTRARAPLASASLLVVGTRGEYGRPAFGLVSVSRVLLKAVGCPVLAVPEVRPSPATAGGRALVVAGIGQHPADAVIARAAVAETFRHGCDVQLVHAYTPRPGETATEATRRAEELVARAAEGALPAPGTRVSVVVTAQPAPRALLTAASGASLLVTGSRPGALAGLVLESVSHELLNSAPCPVLVIPREPTGARARVMEELITAAQPALRP